ncbi:MAG: hypothetical protein U0Q22_15280 [Acidimicrobiales bacterium]
MRHRPIRQAAAGLTLCALAVAGVGCVSTNEVGGSDKATPTTAPPVPQPGTVGADVTYGGVTATVVDIAAFDQSPLDVPRIEVTMRAENTSSTAQRNPDVQLLCDESKKVGDWFLGSTWEPNVELPVNAITQGTVIVGFPLKGDNPEYPVVKCSNAKLRLVLVTSESTSSKVVDVPVDASVISEAIRRPRGPNLPLPLSDS